MREITLADVETAIKSITATALKNEQYFCELDSYAGDADFGVSLASGFRVVSQEWNELDRSSIGGRASARTTAPASPGSASSRSHASTSRTSARWKNAAAPTTR